MENQENTNIPYMIIFFKGEFLEKGEEFEKEQEERLRADAKAYDFEIVYSTKQIKSEETMAIHYKKDDAWKEEKGGYVRKELENLLDTHRNNKIILEESEVEKIEKYLAKTNKELGDLLNKNLVKNVSNKPIKIFIMKGPGVIKHYLDYVKKLRETYFPAPAPETRQTAEACCMPFENGVHRSDDPIEAIWEALNLVPEFVENNIEFQKHVIETLKNMGLPKDFIQSHASGVLKELVADKFVFTH